jgi:hypothetical protein
MVAVLPLAAANHLATLPLLSGHDEPAPRIGAATINSCKSPFKIILVRTLQVVPFVSHGITFEDMRHRFF